MPTRASHEGEHGSAVVDFVLTSFALLALFGSAMAIITNLYLRTVLITAATDAARTMARADVSSGCQAAGVARDTNAEASAVEQARQTAAQLVGDNLSTQVVAHLERTEGFCTAIVIVAASLPGLPLMTNITNFEATAHATLELQK
jgi:hypothetical protein